jgi:hypothetical protein
MAKKRDKEADRHEVRLYNRSKQLIPIEVCPPGGDFFMHRQQIQLRPGKHVTLPKSYLNEKQITNLQKKRFITILYDSEARQKQASS